MIYEIGLIDYGMGNLHSVQKAFARIHHPLKLIRKASDISGCNALILPGVGSFDPAMDQLKSTGLIPSLRQWVHNEKPLLGICLGLQLLFESSEEGRSAGLGFIKGNVQKLPLNLGERVPHMGWASLDQKTECPLLKKNDNNAWVYFVHSYAAVPYNKSSIAASVKFGSQDITAMVWQKKICACQFHPEKSSKFGEKMLIRWVNWLEEGARVFQ